MNDRIVWGETLFSESREPIIVYFKELQSEREETSVDKPSYYYPSGSLLHSKIEYCPTKIARYKSSIGTFRFSLDKDGNAAIEHFDAKVPYVMLPSKVYDPFGRCYPIKRVGSIAGGNVLKGLLIPEGIEIIDGTFANSFSLLDVFYPMSLVYFGEIFWRVPQFEENDGGRVWYSGSPEQWETLIKSDNTRDHMDYTSYDQVVRFYESDTTVRIPEIDITTVNEGNTQNGTIRVCNPVGSFMIPSKWNEGTTNIEITCVGRNAFACNDKLTSLTIPSSVKVIDRDAFYSCSSLKTVIIMNGADELVINDGAFFDCPELSKVEIRRKTRIGDYAFGCKDQKSIEVLYSSKELIHLNSEKAFNNREVTETVLS